MKSLQSSNILLIILNTIVDVNESNKGLQTEMLFSDFFCSADDPVGLCTRGTTAAPGKQKASIIELVVDNSTNNSSSNINIACSNACSRLLDSALPRFLPVLFSCLRFLNSADRTISEPVTD